MTAAARAILAAWLAATFLEEAARAALTLLAMAHARRRAGELPSELSGWFDPGERERAVSYTLARGRLSLAAGAARTALLLAAVLGGLPGALDRLARAVPVHPWLQGAVFVASLFILSQLAGLPVRLYSTFVVEARFGFNRTTAGLFVLDGLKGLALAAVAGTPVLLGLFALMDRGGMLWWLWAFLPAALLQVLLAWLYPAVIAPVFNRFTPLAPGPLRDAVLGLTGRLGVRTAGVFVMDGSRRSGHSNAYLSGLGRARRVVLFDTLVGPRGHPVEEVLAVLAHEIGHGKRLHVARGMALSLAMSLAGLATAGLLAGRQHLHAAFGFSAPSPHALVAVLWLWSGPVSFFLAPLLSAVSRRHETEADRFAVEATGSAHGMKSALLRLARDNLSNLAPHPLDAFFSYSHPALPRRIAALEAHEAELRAGRAPGKTS
jgi:STE24 endopeptidase